MWDSFPRARIPGGDAALTRGGYARRARTMNPWSNHIQLAITRSDVLGRRLLTVCGVAGMKVLWVDVGLG